MRTLQYQLILGQANIFLLILKQKKPHLKTIKTSEYVVLSPIKSFLALLVPLMFTECDNSNQNLRSAVCPSEACDEF